MPLAIEVREDTLEFILKFARERGFNLDYLKDNMESNAEEFGWDTYLITDGDEDDRNRTFTEMAEPDFFHNWKFTYYESSKMFTKIERV